MQIRVRKCAAWFVAAALTAACVAFVCPAAAYADVPTYTYDAASHEASLSGVSNGTDSFDNFKGLMPGDERDQQINVAVKNATGEVRVYVQATADDDTARLLSGMTLSVNAGAGELASGPVAGVFSSPVLVATMQGDSTRQLRLHLTVPTSVGNELADAECPIAWTVTFEDSSGEYAANDGAGERPQTNGFQSLFSKTGDGMSAVAVALVVVALVAACVATKSARERKGMRK